MYICVYVCMYVCMYMCVCMYVCMYVYMYILLIFRDFHAPSKTWLESLVLLIGKKYVGTGHANKRTRLFVYIRLCLVNVPWFLTPPKSFWRVCLQPSIQHRNSISRGSRPRYVRLIQCTSISEISHSNQKHRNSLTGNIINIWSLIYMNSKRGL